MPWTRYFGRYEHEHRFYDWECYCTVPVFEVRLLEHGAPAVGPAMAVSKTGDAYYLHAIDAPPLQRRALVGDAGWFKPS